MIRTLYFTPVMAYLLAATCLMTEDVSAGTDHYLESSIGKVAPFTGMAVETMRPTSFTFDSPLLRITGVYGVGYQAFLQDVQDLELVAVSSHLMEGAEGAGSPAALEKMAPYAYDPMRETQRMFDETQQKYFTVLNEVRAEDVPDPGVAGRGDKLAAEDMPETMDGSQVAAFRGLNDGHKGKKHGRCGQSCDEEGHEGCCCCNKGDGEESCKAGSEECTTGDDSCSCDSENDEDCCNCCCEEGEEETGLLASGAYGSGGSGGYSGFNGGGGGGGIASANSNAEHEEKTVIDVVVPEPSTYLIMGGMVSLAVLVKRKRQRRRETVQE
ncbi:MAG: PEP-CTERM sorting domain-containing protein [Chlamydiales bacterium]|nr:PEP-CTERM sorting domain-containing protein [Chlamydiales bacterium]